ncbi:MAG: hypothetical protein IJP63_07940 [Acholeplasmatales bacterium]|nr:hypothetical protein [Acholeplasmatales bacterium]
MNSLILCEGKSDAIIISYLMIKKYGFEYNADKEFNKNMTPKIDEKGDVSVNWYTRSNGDNLMICGVGGFNNISKFFDKYISSIQLADYNDEKIFSKILIVCDRDNNTSEKIEDAVNNNIEKIEVNFKNSIWNRVDYNSDFNVKKSFNSYLLIIPTSEEGALEEVVLKALAENDDSSCIVKSSISFVDNIREDASKYLNKKRYISKAKVGVTFAVMFPEKLFNFIDEILKSIEWDKYKSMIQSFDVLAEI